VKRVGFQLKIREDLIDDYRAAHDEMWPDMREALRRAGWRNYSLFVRPDGTLFGYFEATDSFDQSLERMSHEEVNEHWQAAMQPFFGGAVPADEMMVELQEVFHLD